MFNLPEIDTRNNRPNPSSEFEDRETMPMIRRDASSLGTASAPPPFHHHQEGEEGEFKVALLKF